MESSKDCAEFRNPLLRLVARLGAGVWSHWDDLRYAAAVIGTVLGVAVRPWAWASPVRKALSRQVVAIGVGPIWFVAALALFVGISVVVQLIFWVGEFGQSQLLGPLLMTVIARELAPVLINLVVLIRSGSAMATELGTMTLNGEVRGLQALGSDPFMQLVLPRVLGMAISTFCLTIVFIPVALASGYLFTALLGQGSHDLFLFADTLSRAVQPRDLLNLLAKCLIPALYSGAVCCIGGLGVDTLQSGIPQAAQRALTRSVIGLFVISAAVSLLTYL